ncbi:type II secretion system protein [bacterium]|nr:type II secretion system protein [bacterium]
MNCARHNAGSAAVHGPAVQEKPARAFTLVELLTVIAIVGLLAALVVPALSRARASAKTAACLGNLRQIGLAVQMYVNDHQGRLPVLQNRTSIDEPLPALDIVLRPPAAGPGVFRCPADEQGLSAASGTSYFWNFLINGQDVGRLFSLAGGTEPERIPLVSDKEAFHPELTSKVNILYVDGHVAKELQFSTGP